MKNKTYWKELLKNFPELFFLSWLDVLPVYDTDGKPIRCCNPIVHFAPENYEQLNKRLQDFGHKFIDSTVWYVAGHHYPKGHWDRAIGFHIDKKELI